MASRNRRGTSKFFGSSDDPLQNILGEFCNEMADLGIRWVTKKASRILELDQMPVADQLQLERLRLSVARQQGDNARAERLSERQLKLLDFKIMEKESELEEVARRKAEAEARMAHTGPQPSSEIVDGALEIPATPSGLVSPEQSEGYNCWIDSFKLGGKVVLILGRRGGGKTALACKIAEYLLVVQRRPFYWAGIPKQARDLLPHWVHLIDYIEQAPPGCTIVTDEAGLRYLSLAFGSEQNVMLRQLLMICRHRGSTLIFCVQNSRDLEASVIRQCDTLVFKEPGLTQGDSERPDLRKRAKQAADAFQSIPKEERIQMSFVVDDSFLGFIKSSVPSFWSDEISHIYGSIDFATMESQLPVREQLKKAVIEETNLLDTATVDKHILEFRRQGDGLETIAKKLGISVWRVRKCLGVS